MIQHLVVCSVLLLVSHGAYAQTGHKYGTFIQPTDTHILYTGRIEDSHPERPVFAYPGVEIRTGFTGTSISMVAKPSSGYFMAQVDGDQPFKVSLIVKGDSVVTLADNLPSGTHQVIVTHIGEGYERLPEFHGFIVDAGDSLIAATPLPSRRMEFIGNSITCGYGIEALEATAPYLEETANYYYTYAARTARALNAQAVVVARSGIGVYRNYNGPQTGDAVNMTTEYPYTLLYNAKFEWNFSRYTPDVVCVDLGTNDTSTRGADFELLQRAFINFYHLLRSHYPDAVIVLLSGCMMQGRALQMVRETLDNTMLQARRQGDSKVYHFDFPPQDGSLGYGASHHPSMEQHQVMAEQLTDYLRRVMHWE